MSQFHFQNTDKLCHSNTFNKCSGFSLSYWNYVGLSFLDVKYRTCFITWTINILYGHHNYFIV